jgi:hypothetical protein
LTHESLFFGHESQISGHESRFFGHETVGENESKPFFYAFFKGPLFFSMTDFQRLA